MSSLATGPSRVGMHLLAIPAAVVLIVFLGYSSQWLFQTATFLEPGPLSTTESAVFNTLLACLWWSYFRACTVDPGRYVFPEAAAHEHGARPPHPTSSSSGGSSSSSSSSSHAPTAAAAAAAAAAPGDPLQPVRWCRKCRAPKPPRAHHCRHCQRCIPKMDHHCPWTGNCVSMQTFPHFLRFVVFTNAALWALAVLLARRFHALYDQRYLPAYLGPTLPQLVHLTLLALVCGATLLALSIMLYNTLQAWAFNTTMIEGWELERHEAVLDRYRATAPDGTWWDPDDDLDAETDVDADADADADADYDNGAAAAAERRARRAAALRRRVEFPYDLGVFDNMAQAMGTRNVLLWFVPLAGGPRVANDTPGRGAGWVWPENGFNDRPGLWPPPDPDRLRHAAVRRRGPGYRDPRDGGGSGGGGGPAESGVAAASGRDGGPPAWGTPEEERAAFYARQQADFQRRRRQQQQQQQQQQQHPFRSDDGDEAHEVDVVLDEGMDGEPGWTNADGDRLRDYGVDEEAEEDDDGGDGDEDVPIARLLQQRRGGQDKKKQ